MQTNFGITVMKKTSYDLKRILTLEASRALRSWTQPSLSENWWFKCFWMNSNVKIDMGAIPLKVTNVSMIPHLSNIKSVDHPLRTKSYTCVLDSFSEPTVYWHYAVNIFFYLFQSNIDLRMTTYTLVSSHDIIVSLTSKSEFYGKFRIVWQYVE